MSNHGVYKVKRKVDTVIVEMDADVAERLTAILGQVIDDTVHGRLDHRPIDKLFNKLADVVREPSPLYVLEIDDSPMYGKAVYLRNTPETGGWNKHSHRKKNHI